MPSIQLPQDDAVKLHETLQWWYWTGHLKAKDGRAFGFEIVFFVGELADLVWGQMAQSAVSDLSANVFVDQEHILPLPPKVLDGAFDLATLDGSIAALGGGGDDRLYTKVKGYELSLTAAALKPATLHYGGLDHPYAFGGDTYYYSRPRMKVSGTLTLPSGEALEVDGECWFDRQFGGLLRAVLVGWQWFAIQLDGDVEIMVFDFNHQPDELYGSISEGQSKVVELGKDDIRVEITDWWTSPDTNIRYPAGWKITVSGRDTLVITPQMADQEMTGRFWLGPHYWEGACTVRRVDGARIGSAYVELVGFEYYGRLGSGLGVGPR